MAKGRPLQEFYTFIHDAANMYYKVSYSAMGNPIVTKDAFQYPVKNPANLKNMQVSFGTNKTYFSGVRAVTLVWNLIEDSADIIRDVKYKGLGYAAELYLLIIRFDPLIGAYRKYYEGRFDLKESKDNPITGYACPCVDTSIWGILSMNDTVDYQINCTQQNPAAIPILFDGITLRSRYTYQPVASTFIIPNNGITAYTKYFTFPLALVNVDGDSFGFIAQSEDFIINDAAAPPEDLIKNKNIQGFAKTTRSVQVHIVGDYIFDWKVTTDGSINGFMPLDVSIIDERGVSLTTIPTLFLEFVADNTYRHSFHVDAIIDMYEGESLYLFGFPHLVTRDTWHITPVVSNIILSLDSKADAEVVYAIRPLDLGKALVGRATNNQFTLNSNFLSLNNKKVVTCGNALRQAPNAYIKSSFQSWFKSYDIEYWLAFRIIQNELWVEPVPTIYDSSTNLFIIGEITEVDIEDAKAYFINEIELNSPKQDYRHSSGRLEFNGQNTFSIKQFNIKNKLSLVSPYRKDGYGAYFILLDYQQQSTKDNSGDDDSFIIEITDEKKSVGSFVENFVTINVDNAPLAPIIYYPLNNDSISNDKPVVTGVCQPLTLINFYVDGSLDGSTTSDAQGNFSYDIQTSLSPYIRDIQSGVHTIDATFTDLTGTLDTISILINTDTTTSEFQYPANEDSIYNNKPLIKGFLQTGVSANIKLDGTIIGTVIGDGNCRFQLQSPIMSNGSHVLDINGVQANINVNSFVDIPLITSFSDGFEIVNNLPLVEGVAIPGTKVDLWLDYYANVSIGTAFANPTGNWSIQLVPLFKSDGVTVLTPIPNGLHIISTDLQIKSTIVSITGFEINRPDYSDIQGVIDNTVINTQLTPFHNLLTRIVFWKSIFYQQPNTVIQFETGDKNQAFSTTLDGVTIKENDNLQLNKYPDLGLFLPYIITAKVQTPFYFVDVIDNFSSGGLIQATYQGLILYALPIGEMTVEDVTNNIQKWSLLLSVKTPLLTLLKLSSPGITINVMKNAIFITDYNTLHWVKYDFTPDAKYNQAELYEDWFNNRNNRWTNNPDYIQKVQRSDGIREQIISNGVSGTILIDVCRCNDAKVVAQVDYVVVTPAPIPPPDFVQEALFDLTSLQDGDYFCVMYVSGVPVSISERWSLSDVWEETILIEANGSRNKPGAIFSDGYKCVQRVEGLVMKLQPNIEQIVNEDEVGDFDLLHSVVSRKRNILFGDGASLPDYRYLKVASAIALDNLLIQGVAYTISQNSKIEPVDRTDGFPMYYYNVEVNLKENNAGITVDSQQGNFQNGVTLVIDAGAFGIGGGGFIEIDLN